MLNKVNSFKTLAGAATFAALAIGASAAQAGVIDVTVPATADIFLAGQTIVPPNGTGPQGSTPWQQQTLGNLSIPGAGTLPVEVTLASVGASPFTIGATGNVNCGYGCGPTGNGPGGSSFAANISYGGLSTAANAMTLLGEWGNAGGVIGNIFTVGTGGSFAPPPGATVLYLGFNDSFFGSTNPGTYNDDTGSLEVSISSVPEPATWALMLLGFAGLGFAGYNKAAKRYGQASAA